MAVPLLDEVHVLTEGKDRPLPSFLQHSPKTREILIPQRPLMGDYIQYSCDHLLDRRVMFANSDIFFDSSLEYFTQIPDKVFDSTFYAISRWRLAEEGMTPHPYPEWGSYDTFVFKPRVICEDKAKLQDLVASLNYTLGILGSENRLLYEVNRRYPELKMENPVDEVRTVHSHNS
ncbi:putative ATP-dependent RNA helicase ddx49, partial [Podila verticillata]